MKLRACLFGAFSVVLGCQVEFRVEVNSRYPSKNFSLFLHPDLSNHASFYSHVCGWEGYGSLGFRRRYIAAVGTREGTVFLDVTNNRIDTSDIVFAPGAPSEWRECRSYGNYVYVVTEGMGYATGQHTMSDSLPGGLQIFRMDGPRPVLVNTFTETFRTAHTVFIDTLTSRAYVNGADMNLSGTHGHHGGMRILDLTDPEHPRDIGGFGSHMERYTHDSYAADSIVYAASIYEGLIRVLDVRDPENVRVIDSVSTPLRFPHNIWLSSDQRWLFSTDERSGSGVSVFDLTDPWRPRFVSVYRSSSVADSSIAHNVLIRGNYAYVAWYTEGVRLIDMTNPLNPREVGFFDTSTRDSREGMEGNWGVYIDSRGFVYASDMDNGLFVLRPSRNIRRK